MKICTKCKQSKEPSYFGKSNRSKDGMHAWCKACVSNARMRRYYENKEEERARGNKRNKDAYELNMCRVYEYLKMHPCVDCGETDPIVLEFDHRDRTNKLLEISVAAKVWFKWERIQDEIDKCEVRCANCHRRKTHKQLNWLVYLQDEVIDNG